MNNSPDDFENAQWSKSTASSATGGCLEVAFLSDGRGGLRDNEDPDNPRSP